MIFTVCTSCGKCPKCGIVPRLHAHETDNDGDKIYKAAFGCDCQFYFVHGDYYATKKGCASAMRHHSYDKYRQDIKWQKPRRFVTL